MVKFCAFFAIFDVILGRFSQFLRDFACFCANFVKMLLNVQMEWGKSAFARVESRLGQRICRSGDSGSVCF